MTAARSFRRVTACTVAAVTTAILVSACAGGGASVSPATSATSATSSAPASAGAAATSTPNTPDASAAAFAALESRYGADLGVYAVEVASVQTVSYNSDERFAFASTYKALAAGVLFARSTDAQLATTITYTSADLVDYSPITEQHVDAGMTLNDIIAAALQYSDNTAGNLMLAQLGGPAGLEGALRGLGDSTTSVDRTEPDVNTAIPGDLRDTTTPAAIGGDLQAFLLGDALTPARRTAMTQLMLGNTTGAPWIRAGLPSGWSVADKTGSGGYGTRNDIAVAFRPNGDAVVISILTDRNVADAASNDALIAEATAQVVTALG